MGMLPSMCSVAARLQSLAHRRKTIQFSEQPNNLNCKPWKTSVFWNTVPGSPDPNMNWWEREPISKREKTTSHAGTKKQCSAHLPSLTFKNYQKLMTCHFSSHGFSIRSSPPKQVFFLNCFFHHWPKNRPFFSAQYQMVGPCSSSLASRTRIPGRHTPWVPAQVLRTWWMRLGKNRDVFVKKSSARSNGWWWLEHFFPWKMGGSFHSYVKSPEYDSWFGGDWNHGMDYYDFPYILWKCHHPNWRTPSFFRGVGWNHQPGSYGDSKRAVLYVMAGIIEPL